MLLNLFDDLNKAIRFAANDAESKALVLMNNATLPAGEYTVLKGVSLLIPFDSTNKMYTTEMENTFDPESGATKYVTQIVSGNKITTKK